MLYRFNMEVAKMFDNDGKSKTWREYKNAINRNNFLSKESFSDYLAAFSKAKSSIEAIINRRNKFLAHSDGRMWVDSNAVISENPIDYEDVEALLYSMMEICNRIVLIYSEDRPANLFSDNQGDDFVRLFGMKTLGEVEAEKLFELLK